MQTKTKVAPARRATLSIAAKPATNGAEPMQACDQPPATPTIALGPEPKAIGSEPIIKVAEPTTPPTKTKAGTASHIAAAWSPEDESAYQALLARRKAAGYNRRRRDVAAQRVCVGKITPNASTVVATVVALVAERGTPTRGELLDAMAKATFPHSRARPEDRGWCQGYVAGALRDGFLALSNENSLRADSAEDSR